MATRFVNPVTQYLDSNGDPFAGGKLFFFKTGTSTPLDTFSNQGGTIANANPVILDASGQVPDIFLDGDYKVQFKDSDDVQIWERDPVSNNLQAIAFGDHSTLISYSIGDIVTGSDGLRYESLTNNNLNNDPTTDAVNWQKFEFVFFFNTNRIYAVDDRVRTTNGIIFVSLTASNTGNDPLTSPTNWQALDIRTWSAAQTFGLLEIVKASDGLLYTSTIASNTNNDPTSDVVNWKPAVVKQIAADVAFTPAGNITSTDVQAAIEENDTAITLAKGSLIFLSTVTASASATVDIEDTIDSTFDAYVIEVTNLKVATDNVNLLCRMKTSGSYITSATYKYHVATVGSGSTAYVGNANNADTSILLNSGMSNASFESSSLTMAFKGPSGTGIEKKLEWHTAGHDNSGFVKGGFGFGLNTATTTITGIRFFAATGNIASGTFRLYGIRNS